jgi:hypothetical protein
LFIIGTSIVDSAARADVEDFQSGCGFAEDNAKVADSKATLPGAHREHHVCKRLRFSRVVSIF